MLFRKNCQTVISLFPDAGPVDGLWLDSTPHKRWKAFSRRIRGLVKAERTLFFTTYKFRTGSMYTCMKRTMGVPASCSVPFLKSRTGFLTESDKKQLDQFIAMYSIH